MREYKTQQENSEEWDKQHPEQSINLKMSFYDFSDKYPEVNCPACEKKMTWAKTGKYAFCFNCYSSVTFGDKGLAEIYREQGYKISVGSAHRNEIKQKIMEVTGLCDYTVESYLGSEFLQPERPHLTIMAKEPKLSASERIEHELGEEYVERFRKQVLAEEKLSPEVRKNRR